MCTALTDGQRFSHIERLREDLTIPELFGMDLVFGGGTVRDSANRLIRSWKRSGSSARPSRCGECYPIRLSLTGIQTVHNRGMDTKRAPRSAAIPVSQDDEAFIRCWPLSRGRGFSGLSLSFRRPGEREPVTHPPWRMESGGCAIVRYLFTVGIVVSNTMRVWPGIKRFPVGPSSS